MAKIADESWDPTKNPEPGRPMPPNFPGVPPMIPGQINDDKGGEPPKQTEPPKKPEQPTVPGSPKGDYTPAAPKYDENTKLNIPKPTPVGPAKRAELNPTYEEKTIDRVGYYDKQPMIDMAKEQMELARQQYNQQVDQSMDTNASDLNRALSDAQGQFQTQQNQIDANERNALDNAALYAEVRGDKGGIGQAQYNNIQNTAAQNRQSVRQAQTKLATDTARQISDLRAKGEFDKADKALELAQTYLSELRQIEEYAANYNLSVDQINTAIAEWEAEFNNANRQFADNMELTLAQLTGQFSNGMSTKDALDKLNQNMAQIALGMLEAGVEPTKLSPKQLAALAEVYGMDQSAINNYFKKITGR